jgi:hypothetical protein
MPTKCPPGRTATLKPVLRHSCPVCHATLVHRESRLADTKGRRDQIDVLWCGSDALLFEYRRRTRTLRWLWPRGDRPRSPTHL